ncbi:MAG: hypothetical protein LBI31_02970, partial [Zoogloeaceae bacterium]|nr:hypothetical protein [Zoogloeaceae bacterium]
QSFKQAFDSQNAINLKTLADAEAAPEGGGALDEASRFLSDIPSRGAKPVHEVVEAAVEGLAARTVRRAAKALGIVSEAAGFQKGRIWMLPP